MARPVRKPRDRELIRQFGCSLRAARQDKGWYLTGMWLACGIAVAKGHAHMP